MPTEGGRDRASVHEAVCTLLDDRPDAETALEAVLDVDADRETWTFEDVRADSGTFVELVSRGIVEKVDGEYQLADRNAVDAALARESAGVSDDGTVGDRFEAALDVSFDPRSMAGLAGALAFLFVMRITAYGSVMRDEHVLSPGNAPTTSGTGWRSCWRGPPGRQTGA